MTLPTKISNQMGKTRSITVPAILVLTILIAGFFAFSPVQQASTVHSASLIESNTGGILQTIQTHSDSGTGITDGDTVVIDCDNDFVVLDMYWRIDDLDGTAGENLRIGTGAGSFITVDGAVIIGESEDQDQGFDILGNNDGTSDNVDVQRSWKGVTMDEIGAGNPGGVNFPLQLFAVGADANDIVITMADGDGGKNFDVGDTLTVTALIQTESNAGCSVDVIT